MWKKKKGDAAEGLALEYLRAAGLRLVTRNYRCRTGEIDLIMEDADSLVFVEVRYRQRSDFGGALGSVDYYKQKKLIAAARHYLHTLKRLPACRFDVVAVQPDQRVEWLKNAFDAE